MEKSHRSFVKGTSAMLTSKLANKNMSSLQHSINQKAVFFIVLLCSLVISWGTK